MIRAWRATTTGIPFDFKEADGKHRPRSSFGHVLTSPDVRLDGKGIARMIYVNAANAKLVYRTFSTKTGRWGAAATVAGNATTPDESGSLGAKRPARWFSTGMAVHKWCSCRAPTCGTFT